MWYELHWKSGSVDYIEGSNIVIAFNKNGFNGEAIDNLKFYREASTIPLEYKKFHFIEGCYDTIVTDTVFKNQIIDYIKADKLSDITIIFKHKKYLLNIVNDDFDIYCNSVSVKNRVYNTSKHKK